MNWTVKKTTLIISKIEKKSSKNHTILSTYQELIKQERQKHKENISSLYLYWATHMFWNICDDHYFTFGSTIFKLLYLLIIIILKRKLLTSS
jgi:hypothetical protein